MKIQKENSTKINYLKNGEQIANQYALKSVPCECSQHEGAVFPCIVRKKTQVPNTA